MLAENKITPSAIIEDFANSIGEADLSPKKAAQYWLGVQCNMISGVSCGLLFKLPEGAKTAVLEASWPEPMTVGDDLVSKVRLAAVRDTLQVENCSGGADADGSIRLYYSFTEASSEAASFVIVLEMSDRDENERNTVAKLLRWNSELLQFALASTRLSRGEGLAPVFKMAHTCLDQQGFRATATALVTELVAYFDCQRVSLGLRRGQHMQVQVLSHSARFKQEANLIQAIGAAMDEAADQDCLIAYPDEVTQSNAITQAHAELARQSHGGYICTVPMCEGEQVVGAITMEWSADFPLSETEVRLVERLAALVGPVLSLRFAQERGLPVKAWHSLKETIRHLFGAEHIRLKLGALATTLLLLFFSFADGTWRVTADALVEGSVQRTVAAPIDGYIATVDARAGDVVTAGQQMGALDDSDLHLQRLKWSTLRQQMISESREAMAQHDRAQVSIINAKIEQADAELELIDVQLSRTKLMAPYDGIVIEGDLSQLLGTPVSRGDVLFKVAPLNGYRIVLKVNEKDISPVQPGQQGNLILASMPSEKLTFKVTKVTPVSTAKNGSNFFRVEASLLDGPTQLQPGMEGVGKIELGEANLFWLWTRDLVNWLRLQTWTWWR